MYRQVDGVLTQGRGRTHKRQLQQMWSRFSKRNCPFAEADAGA